MKDSSGLPTRLGVDGAEALRLVRADTPQSLQRLQACAPEELALAVQELPAKLRVELLELSDRVGEIVPLLPEAELASTIRAVGLADAGWLVEYATTEQRVAAVDLDCWKDDRFSRLRLFEWIDALIEAGSETLAAGFSELDAELWVLAMKEMADFSMAGLGDDSIGDWMTEDGSVFYSPRSGEHEERLRVILRTAWTESPGHYHFFVQGAIFENLVECEEYAARWHAGRLNDLGFPDRDDAMIAYRPLRPEAMPVIDLGDDLDPSGARPSSGAHLPELMEGTHLGRALQELPQDRATEILGYVLAVANTLAVADELSLTDPESVQRSLTKALRGIECGLVALSGAQQQRPARLLDGVAPLDLFRVGVTLDPSLGRVQSLADFEAAEQRSDWDEVVEMIADADLTVGEDGRLRR